MSFTILFDEPFSGGSNTVSTDNVPWWRSTYPFRRRLLLDPLGQLVESGHPVEITLPKLITVDKGKVRQDFKDIAILYATISVGGTKWQQLDIDVEETTTDFTVFFPVQDPFSDVNNRYYVYYGNESLSGVIGDPNPHAFQVPDWPVTVSANGIGVSYTRPGKDWVFSDAAIASAAIEGNTIGTFLQTVETFTTPGGGFASAEIDITPVIDGFPDGYFFAHQFLFQVTTGIPGQSMGGYVGLQTNGANLGGHVAHFAGWGATTATSSGFAGTFTNEGLGWKTQISYPWKIDRTYRCRVALVTDDSTNQTWAAYVKDVLTDEETEIGRITWPSSIGHLQGVTASFHERYSGSPVIVQQSSVIFSNPTMNQGSVLPLQQNVIDEPVANIPSFHRMLGTNMVQSFASLPPDSPAVIATSSVTNSQATFIFYGDQVQLLAQTSPVSGIAQVKLDDDPSENISFFSDETIPAVPIWSKAELSQGLHRVFVLVSGEKESPSRGTALSVAGFNFRRAIVVTDLGEETDQLSWSSVFVGGAP